MAIILFLVDTSASMAQKTYRGNSLLDVCKNFIAEFIKMRGRDLSVRGFDRYMFMTTEDFPTCIKELRTNWRENVLMELMKPLRPRGRSFLPAALQNVFKVINITRAQSGIENYGYGRYPFYMEQLVVIALTDGTGIDEMPHDVRLENRNRHDFTKEVFRWDERLFSVSLRIPGQNPANHLANRLDNDVDKIERLCTSTGGRSYVIANYRQIMMVIESLILSLQNPGVLVKFSSPMLHSLVNTLSSGPNGIAEAQPEIRLKKALDAMPLTNLIVKVVSGKAVTNHWPIPESFWPKHLDSNALLPLRSCHPMIVINMDFKPSQIMPDFPFDKYELEPCALVDYIVEKTKASGNPDQCLFAFIQNSHKVEGIGKPFGYLKMTSAGTGVNLFIMPYNFPSLFPLLHELKTDGNARNDQDWKRRFNSYLDSLPAYYMTPMRKNLAKFRITGTLLDDLSANGIYSPTLMGILNRAKPIGKEEYDRLATIVASQLQELNVSSQGNSTLQQLIAMERRSRPISTERKHWRIEAEPNRKDIVGNPRTRRDPRSSFPVIDDTVFKDPNEDVADPVAEKISNVQILVSEGRIRPHPGSAFRNPLILKKHQVISEMVRMKVNMTMLLRSSNVPLLDGGRPDLQMKLHHSDEMHSLPIAQMGNYEDYIKALQATGRGPLRDVEEKPVRTHGYFGNPFKTDKKNMAIDEVGEGADNSATTNSAAAKERKDRRAGVVTKRPPKKKAGPLGLNSMSTYRERLRSISECSSVVSDTSYTTDIEMGDSDIDDASIASTSKGLNGLAINGNGNASTPGLEPMDAEPSSHHAQNGFSDEPPSKKSRKHSPDSHPHVLLKSRKKLSRDQIISKKTSISGIVRNTRICPDALKQIIRQIENCCPSDAVEVLTFTQRDALREKRSDLTKMIAEEIVKWKTFLL